MKYSYQSLGSLGRRNVAILMTEGTAYPHVPTPPSQKFNSSVSSRPPTPHPQFLTSSQSFCDLFNDNITHEYSSSPPSCDSPSTSSFDESSSNSNSMSDDFFHPLEPEISLHTNHFFGSSVEDLLHEAQSDCSDIISTTPPSEISDLDPYYTDELIWGNLPASNCKGKDIADDFSNLKECVICADSKEQSEFSAITADCHHERNVCNECVKRHIEVELLEKGNYNILCPSDAECRAVLHETDVKRFSNDRAFQRYQLLSLNAVLSQMPDFRWCTNPRCEFGQIHYEGDAAPIMACVECGQKSCVIHDLAIHDGTQCIECNDTSNPTTNQSADGQPESSVDSEAVHSRRNKGRKFYYIIKRLQRLIRAHEKRRAERAACKAAKTVEKMKQMNEKLSSDWITVQTKACPECKCRIQKDIGCDHMTCRCGHEFCWLCFADYNLIRDHGNQYHDTKCRYHAL